MTSPAAALPAPVPLLRKIRLGAAIALFCALFLPLSRCSRGSAPQSPAAEKSVGQRLFPRGDTDTTYTYALGEVEFSLRGGLTLLAFTWPVLLIFAGGKFKTSRFAWILSVLELSLTAGALYWLRALTLFDEWLYGAYIAFSAIVVFGCTALYSLFIALRAAIIRRRSLRQPPAGTP